MTVTVLLFARYREAAGAPSLTLDLPVGSTLGDAWHAVRERVPALRQEAGPLLACDRQYAPRERPLQGGEEIAAFPPVSGG